MYKKLCKRFGKMTKCSIADAAPIGADSAPIGADQRWPAPIGADNFFWTFYRRRSAPISADNRRSAPTRR